MTDDAELAGLEAERARLYAELSGPGGSRRCARPGDRGHGPQWNWVRWAGGKTVTVHPRPGPELEKAQRESAQWERFGELTSRIEAVNEAICDARPALSDPGAPAPDPEGQKRGGSARSSRSGSRSRPPRR